MDDFEYESINLGEEELIYCKNCREFYSAFSNDGGSYFCPKCEHTKIQSWTPMVEAELKKFANELYLKSRFKNICLND